MSVTFVRNYLLQIADVIEIQKITELHHDSYINPCKPALVLS